MVVNNAASFYAGYFEELTPEQIGQQLATSLIGPMNVTRAVLLAMRKQRSGHIISISSSAGLAAGFEFVTALRRIEVRPRGVDGIPAGGGRAVRHRHDHRQSGILSDRTSHRAIDNYAEPSIADYAERRGPLVEYWKAQNGQQSGDPAKLARALVTIASGTEPPRRFIAGADAIAPPSTRLPI